VWNLIDVEVSIVFSAFSAYTDPFSEMGRFENNFMCVIDLMESK